MNSSTSGPSGNCSKQLVSESIIFFDQSTCFSKDILVSKQKILYVVDFDQIIYIYHENIEDNFLKSLKAIEQRYWLNLAQTGSHLIFSNSFSPIWFLLSCWRQYLIHLFWTVCNLLLIFFRDLHAKLIRSLYKYSSRSSKIVSNSITRMVSCEAFFVTKHVRCSTCHNITFTV